MTSKGWIGVDLDGTLAYYDGWRGMGHIGQPIPKMLQRVKQILKAGIYDVKIMTARAGTEGEELKTFTDALDSWCLEHLGQRLVATCKKDFSMVYLYDDRAKQVVPNTGVLLEEVVAELEDFKFRYESVSK